MARSLLRFLLPSPSITPLFSPPYLIEISAFNNLSPFSLRSLPYHIEISTFNNLSPPSTISQTNSPILHTNRLRATRRRSSSFSSFGFRIFLSTIMVSSLSTAFSAFTNEVIWLIIPDRRIWDTLDGCLPSSRNTIVAESN